MLPFFDSHAHLADPAFDGDRDDVVLRARSAGATGIICIGESIAAARRSRQIAAGHPDLLAFTAGVHPHEAASFDLSRDPDDIRELVASGAVAIGECGLDYHYDNSPRMEQRRAFVAQLELAVELKLPVVVHTRDAEGDTIAMLREAAQAGVRGVVHCFTGTQALADAAIESGWSISLTGIITFRKWSDEELIRTIPADRLMIESDSPYLAPVPHRGARNEPAWVELTLVRLAAARSDDPVTLAEQLLLNTRKFFGVAPSLR